MNSLFIEAKDDSPEISLDKEKNTFKITGNSFSDDPLNTYQAVIDWLLDYSRDPNKNTILDFKLHYINTASSKQIVNILMIMENMAQKTDIRIKWHYQKGDDDMLDEGEALSSMINLNFEFIEY